MTAFIYSMNLFKDLWHFNKLSYYLDGKMSQLNFKGLKVERSIQQFRIVSFQEYRCQNWEALKPQQHRHRPLLTPNCPHNENFYHLNTCVLQQQFPGRTFDVCEDKLKRNKSSNDSTITHPLIHLNI